jgi:hypothetical protein
VPKQDKKNSLTLEELERCYIIAARVVAEFGDTYLPLFERMHREVEMAKKASELKRLALAVVDENKKTLT